MAPSPLFFAQYYSFLFICFSAVCNQKQPPPPPHPGHSPWHPHYTGGPTHYHRLLQGRPWHPYYITVIRLPRGRVRTYIHIRTHAHRKAYAYEFHIYIICMYVYTHALTCRITYMYNTHMRTRVYAYIQYTGRPWHLWPGRAPMAPVAGVAEGTSMANRGRKNESDGSDNEMWWWCFVVTAIARATSPMLLSA